MRFRAAIIILAPILTAFGQQAGQQNEHRYVIVPPESILLVVASQPDCPLKFENAKLLISADGNDAWGASYKLRNEGTKAIKTFTAVMWTSYGSGGTLGRPKNIDDALILPGQTVKGDDQEILSLTNEMRDKLKLRGPMKAIVVLMIEKIKFADGSTYNDEMISQAVLAYFDDLDSRVHHAKRQK